MREVRDVDTKHTHKVCFRCGYKEDTRVKDICDLLCTYQKRIEVLERKLETKQDQPEVTCTICGKEIYLKDVFSTWITSEQEYYFCSYKCFENRLNNVTT